MDLGLRQARILRQALFPEPDPDFNNFDPEDIELTRKEISGDRIHEARKEMDKLQLRVTKKRPGLRMCDS